MKEILIRFSDEESPSAFLRNPFDVFIDGEKIFHLKRIEIDFSKYESNQNIANFDDFRYKVEQYIDMFGVDD